MGKGLLIYLKMIGFPWGMSISWKALFSMYLFYAVLISYPSFCIECKVINLTDVLSHFYTEFVKEERVRPSFVILQQHVCLMHPYSA